MLPPPDKFTLAPVERKTMYDGIMRSNALGRWIARALVAAVFAMNLQSALVFILNPASYASALELTGTSGMYSVQAMGILFLMWNATYPPVILYPARYRLLFGVVVAQQLIGLAGESWLLSNLPSSHAALASTAARFIFFDTLGLIALIAAFLISRDRLPR
jgi:CHASE1-domain containing sensor protein